MKQYQRKIKEYKSLIQKEYIQETAVCTVMERCSDIVSRQDNRRASYFEFLFEQFKFIKKRWWALHGFCWRTQMEEQIQSGHWGLCR